MKQILAVSVPVTDLRALPEIKRASDGRDLNRESQLLFGEVVSLLDNRGEYSFVEVLDQMVCQNGFWIPYQGLVKSKDLRLPSKVSKQKNLVAINPSSVIVNSKGRQLSLSIGTLISGVQSNNHWNIIDPFGEAWTASLEHFSVTGSDVNSNCLVANAKRFIGWPYLWGGRSSYSTSQTSVDCSGFIHLLYQMAGLSIPRNSHDQYLKANKVSSLELKESDLIFTTEGGSSDRIKHVMLYIGNGELIESTIATNSVRQIAFQKRFGFPLSGIKNGEQKGEFTLYFGSYRN